MSIARKCDICGSYYDLHGIQSGKENTNVIMFLNEDMNGKHYKNDVVKCCSRCMKSIRVYIDAMSKGDKDE